MSRADYSYTTFDAMLLDLIRNGKTRMAQLELHQPLLELAKPFCIAKPGSHQPPEWRIIDRRLQALRKAGKIKYSSAAGWRIVD